MIDRSEVGMLPISSLNAMEYCPRRFYYQFVQGEMLVNEFVLEGTLEHQRVHQAGSHRTGMEEIETTRLYLYSEALRVSGFADVIQERGRPPAYIPYGYIFYVGSRRRVKVHFTEQLRARTLETIAKALKVATLNAPPPPLSGKMVERCPDCSLLPLCMPEEVRMLQSKKRR